MMPRAALILQNDDPVIEDEEDEDDEDDDDDEDEGEAEGKSLQNVILGLLCEWSMFHLFLQATELIHLSVLSTFENLMMQWSIFAHGLWNVFLGENIFHSLEDELSSMW